MNAGKVSDEIKDAIAYNNARSVNVALSCKDEEGSLFPQPTYQAKLGYDFEVQFIPNTQNYLVTDLSTMLKAVSRIDEESRADCVEFTPIEQSYEDKKSGLYRVNVKVIKYADDIKICPNGTLIPKVNEIYPPYNPAGYNQDTMIKVTFNKPVDPESFGNFNCLRFESAGQDISDCYATPFFSSDNLVLNIPTDPGKKIIAEQAQNNTAEVILKIACTNLKDTDGLSITQVEPYTYCVNRTTDSIAPHITSYEMTTTGNTEAWYYRTLTDKAVLQWSGAQVLEDDNTTVKYYCGDYSRNHVGKSVHIKLQGYDNADAISGLLVREVFEKDISGNAAGENELTKFVDDFEILTDSNGNPVLSGDGKIIYSFDFDYVLQSKGDGLVLLELHLKDGANNGDYKDYEVIKQSETNNSIQFKLELDKAGILPQLVGGKYKSHLCSNSFQIYAKENIYLNYLNTTTKFSLYVYDENDNPSEIFTHENFTEVPNDGDIKTVFNEYVKDVLIDSYRDTKAKAVYYEENGLTKEMDFIIPAAPHGIFFGNGNPPTVQTTYGPPPYLNCIYITYQASKSAPVTKSWPGCTEDDLRGIYSTTSTSNYPMGLYKIYSKRDEKVLTINGYMSYVRSSYGEPCSYAKNGTISTTFSISSNIKGATYEPSTGMATVEFNITYPDDNNTYYIEVDSVDGYTAYYSEPNGKTVTIPNGYEYMGYYILRVNPDTGIDAYCGKSQTISLKTNDNFPPEMTCDKSYWDSSYFYINKVSITDKKEGLADNTNHGITSFVCYYAKTDLGNNPSVETLKQKSVDIKTINFEPDLDPDPGHVGKLCAKIPFSDVEQGEYYLYAYLKDNNNNGKVMPLSQQSIGTIQHGIYFSLRDATPSIVKQADKKLQIKKPEDYLDSVRMNRYRLEQQNGKWAWVEWDGLSGYTYNSSLSNTSDYEETKDSFIMVNSRDMGGSWGTYHLKPLYYYPNYENGDITCLSTSWMKVDNGWHIFCDAPAFCHTLYSKRKITSGNSEKDASEWEAQAQEIGIVFSQNGTDFTYKDTNLVEVPDGNWYTTICHFADGTVLMSPVEQMHK